MNFIVRDLMFNVLPAADAQALELMPPCQLASQGAPKPYPQPKPEPGPKKPPQPGPECTLQSQTGKSAAEWAPELASLAVLREQLRQALHP
ncbi:MAG: hypothetical protein JOZ15_15110 [Acidobacteria bacterium]|nr:hypothetical protein [Acidobacteriota bacterium]